MCNAMRSLHQYSTSESMACKMDLTCNLALPGSKIPDWFSHQSVRSSITFSIGRNFPAMAFCVTLEVEFESYGENGKFDCSIYSSISGCKRQHANYRLLLDSSTIMFFHYIRFVDSSMKPIILGDRNEVTFGCEISNYNCEVVEVTIKRCGVHVACICLPRNSKEAGIRIHERLKEPFDERLKVFLSKVAAEFLPF